MKAWAGSIRTHRRFLLLAALCIVLSLLAALFCIRSLLLPDVGLLCSYPETVVQNGRLLFSPSKPFSTAATAGLIPDKDMLIAVNGLEVHTSRDLVKAVASIHGFAPFSVEVEHPNGTRELLWITPSFRPARLDWICLLLFGLSLALTAWVVSWRLPQEDYALPIVLSGLLSLVFTFIMPFAYENAFMNACYNVGNIASWLLVIFALYFPVKRGPPAARTAAIIVIVGAYVAFCFLRVGIFDRWMASGDEGLFTLYKRIGQAGNVSDGIAYAVLAILLGTQYARSSAVRHRAMLAWMIAGMLIALPPYFFLDQLPEIIGGAARGVGLGGLSQLFLSALPVLFLVALTHHAVLDLRAFLARYAMWGTLIVLATGLFTVTYLPFASLVRDSYRLATPIPELFSAGAIMALLAVARWQLERLYRSLVQRRTVIEPGTTMTMGYKVNRLGESRALLSGVVRELRDPVRALRESQVVIGNRRELEAVDRVAGFLHDLQKRVGSSSGISGAATPREIVLIALDRVRLQFPKIDFDLRGDDGQRISCFPGELVQVVAEVLSNAAEATPSGPACVNVRIDASRDGSTIEISDEGPGVEARARRRLYQPFVTTKAGHAGLGLYLAKIVMESNGGAIELSPHEGRGTTARLVLASRHREKSRESEES